MNQNLRVLGIETSCDETGVAIYDGDLGLMAHTLFSQAHIHAEYGGVVPEIASRDHVRILLPLLDECLDKAGCSKTDLDGIAYTAGPGLIGALLVGCVAKTWRFGWLRCRRRQGRPYCPARWRTPTTNSAG